MKIRCLKDELLKGVQVVQNAVSPRATLPILSNILLECDGDHIQLSSTDLEVCIRCRVRADVRESGATTIPARVFFDFLRTLEEGRELDIQIQEGQRIEIRSGRDRCVLVGLPKEDYPLLPDFKVDQSFSVSTSLFADMIRKTIFAVSTDETRYVLNGVNIIVEAGHLTLVATDGRRLAHISRPIEDKRFSANAIVPTKALTEVGRVLSSAPHGGILRMAFTDNQAALQCENTLILSRLIEGHFPNFEQVIPKTHTIQLRLPTRLFLYATQRASVGTLERGGSVRYNLSSGMLKVSASAQGRVEVESELEVGYAGTPFEVAFNPLYIMDVLKALEEEAIFFELTTPLNPGVVRPTGDDHYKCVLMPMKIA